MRFWPTGIRGRVILIMLVGFTAFHILSLAIYSLDLSNELGLSSERNFSQRIGELWRLMGDTPAADRERVAHSASGTLVQVHWSPRSFAEPTSQQDDRTRRLAEQIRSTGANLGKNDLLVGYAEASPIDAEVAPSTDRPLDHALLISLRLPDASWLNFAVTQLDQPRWGSWHLVLSTSLMALGVVVLVALSVRLLTAPLHTLARAADRLGMDVDAPAIPETGPTEVRTAARAFNGMQERIKRLVADRTQTLAAISHDLRTPITRLRLRAEFIEDDEQRQKMLTDLDDMDAMITSTLAFVRGDRTSEEPKVVDMTAMLATICDDMVDAGMQLTFDGGPQAPLSCRPLAMKRAFTNLLDNAVKYGRRAHARLRSSPDSILVEIDDEGPGIASDEMAKVFSPFYRVDPSRSRETGGAGLGLTVAQSIIRSHGGEITLETLQPRGLRVSVSLPRRE